MIMAKDLFSRHTHIRPIGYEVRKKIEGSSFLLKHKRSECADFYITFDFGESYFTLFNFRLSFCVNCGRFLGFGTRYEICWICELELE
jgi:hypothetical protein